MKINLEVYLLFNHVLPICNIPEMNDNAVIRVFVLLKSLVQLWLELSNFVNQSKLYSSVNFTQNFPPSPCIITICKQLCVYKFFYKEQFDNLVRLQNKISSSFFSRWAYWPNSKFLLFISVLGEYYSLSTEEMKRRNFEFGQQSACPAGKE